MNENQRKAIRLFLSKPAPVQFGCGCTGPQPIDSSRTENFYIVKLIDVSDRLETMKIIKGYYCLPTQAAKHALSVNQFKFDYDLQVAIFTKALADVGCTTEVTRIGNGYYPVCPCMMKYVSEVDGRFYNVVEHRSPDGITHTAVDLGPVGGPYINC